MVNVVRNSGLRALPYTLPVALCAALLVFMAGAAEADFIVLKNGNRLNGLVRDETPQWVRFETLAGVLTLDRRYVDRIEKQPRAENLLFSARLELRKPDLMRAVALLEQALEAGADVLKVRQTIIEVSPFFLDRLGYSSRTERAEWTAFCDKLSGGAPDRGEWGYLRGEMAVAMGDHDGALRAWEATDSAYFFANRDKRDRVVRWALRRIGEALPERKFDQAVAVLELLNRLDPKRARSCRVVVIMQKAAAARDRGNVAEACRIYIEELMPLAPEIAKVSLRNALEPHCQILFERGKWREAIALAKSAKPYLPEMADRLLAAAYRGQIRECLDKGRWDMARGLLAESSDLFTTAELQRLKQDCLYGERRETLAPDDYAGHYKLGLELREKNMNDAAIEEFTIAARSPQLRDIAQKQIAMIRDDQALDLMQLIVARFDDERYVDVLDLVDRFRKNFPHSKHLEAVNRIGRRAQARMVERAQKAEQLARSRVEHARRLYYLDKLDQALELLDSVLREFPTASAASDARRLKQIIIKRRVATNVATAAVPNPGSSKHRSSAALLPAIDPALLDELDEDAFKAEIQQVLDQLRF